MKLEMAILAGPESKVFLVELTKQIDRMEKLTKGGKCTVSETKSEETDEDTDFGDNGNTDDFEENAEPAKRGRPKKAAASFDDEDGGDEEELAASAPTKRGRPKKEAASFDDENETDDEETDEISTASLKKGKPKKITLDDLNDAAKERVKSLIENGSTSKEARNKVVLLLQRKFKTDTLTEIEPADYAKAIEVLKG